MLQGANKAVQPMAAAFSAISCTWQHPTPPYTTSLAVLLLPLNAAVANTSKARSTKQVQPAADADKQHHLLLNTAAQTLLLLRLLLLLLTDDDRGDHPSCGCCRWEWVSHPLWGTTTQQAGSRHSKRHRVSTQCVVSMAGLSVSAHGVVCCSEVEAQSLCF
jgi:hypothetical protein